MLVSIMLFQNALAGTANIYGNSSYPYGNQILSFSGNLTKSNLKIGDSRPARSLWHAVRFYDVINQKYITPPSQSGYMYDGTYVNTNQFDLVESQPGDNFSGIRGYHAIPINKVQDIADFTLGNKTYLQNVANASTMDGDADTNGRARRYTVNIYQTWVDFGNIVYFSGGGESSSVSSGNGTSSPLFKTTYKVTPWPQVQKFQVLGKPLTPQPIVVDDKGKLEVKGSSYAVSNGGSILSLDIKAPDGSTYKKYEKNKPAAELFTASIKRQNSQYRYPVDGTIDIKTIVKPNVAGVYEVQLVISDPFSRETKSAVLKIDYQPQGGVNLKALQLVPSSKPRNGDVVYYNLQVINESATPVTSIVGFNSSIGNPQNVVNRPTTYFPYQWVTGGNIPGNINQYNFPPNTPVWVNDIPIPVQKNPDGTDRTKFFAIAGINHYHMMPNPEAVFPTAATWPDDNFKFVEVNLNPKPNFVAKKIEPGIKEDCSGGNSKFTVSMDTMGSDQTP